MTKCFVPCPDRRDSRQTDRRVSNTPFDGPEKRRASRRQRDLALKKAQEEAQGKLWTGFVWVCFTLHTGFVVASVVL